MVLTCPLFSVTGLGSAYVCVSPTACSCGSELATDSIIASFAIPAEYIGTALGCVCRFTFAATRLTLAFSKLAPAWFVMTASLSSIRSSPLSTAL